MLSELYIENIAIIEKTSIQFDHGFNVLTGETGAGKSILIGSINAILGERVSRDIVRTGAERAVVTAVFSDIQNSVLEYLDEKGFILEDGEPLIISREINSDGRSYCRILGRPTSASMLRELGGLLINIHGQHDNQSLLSQDKHMDFIDLYGDLDLYLKKYQKSYEKLVQIQNKLSSIDIDENQKQNRIEALTYQIDEIESVGLSESEEIDLINQHKFIQNSTKILESLNLAYEALLSDDDQNIGAVENIDTAANSLENIQDFLGDYENIVERLREIYYETKEISSDISDLLSSVDFDDSKADEVESRLDIIYRIKRKYSMDVSTILNYLNECKKELIEISTLDETKAELEKELENVKNQTQKYADDLTKKRISAIKHFTGMVCEQLKFLDMPNVVLTYLHEKGSLRRSGQDTLYFLISTNKGEAPKSLAKIASGGELSRIMLSIKSVLADKDTIKTLIFDEIDTGVSGRAAQKIGEKLSLLSNGRQVICITHLPQIAAMADTHMLIEKNTLSSKTFTSVVKLDREQRKHELGRIIAGDKITPLLLQNVEEMLQSSGK